MLALIVAFLLFTPIPKVSAISTYNAFSLSTVPEEISAPCVNYQSVAVYFPTHTIRTFTCSTLVSDILKELNEDAKKYEVVFDKPTDSGRDIALVTVERTRTLVWNKLNYPTEITYTKSLPHRKRVTVQKGAPGLQGVITELITFPDGKKVTKTIAKWVEKEPKVELANVGTKYNLQTTIVDGKTISYWGTLKVKATSYDHSCYGCNYTTATGAYLKKGIVAVDPKVIAMHTTMYIPGYGFGKAEDTGGKIKGNKIDLAYDDIRYGDWSKRWVTIYLVD